MDRSWRLETREKGGKSDGCVEEDSGEVQLTAIDSHFHLDRLCSRLKIGVDYQLALKKAKPEKKEDQVEVLGAVAVFCDPWSYPTSDMVQELRKQGVVSVIGLHPGRVNVKGAIKLLKRALEECEVVGLGDVGLDGTKADFRSQKEQLRERFFLY